MSLVTRKYGPTAKGSKLSIQEMDENLLYLDEPTAINDITEISVTAPSDGDVLKYNSSTSVWENNSSLKLENVPAFEDDANAAVGGLTTGDLYQTTGSGAAPLNVAGILMIKQ